MVVKYSKEVSNYNKQNLYDLLINVPDQYISELAKYNSEKYYIKIMGDIHRSQYISGSNNLFWFKIKGYSDGKEIPEFNSIHIYVCFRLFNFKNSNYILGKCVIPDVIKETDLPNISNLMGFWEFRDISYGH